MTNHLSYSAIIISVFCLTISTTGLEIGFLRATNQNDKEATRDLYSIPNVDDILSGNFEASFGSSSSTGSVVSTVNGTDTANATEGNATVIVGTSTVTSSSNTNSNYGSGSSVAGNHQNGLDNLPAVPGLDSISIPQISNPFSPNLPSPVPPDPVPDIIEEEVLEDGSTEITVTIPPNIFCFPGTTMVHVQDRGMVEIRNVKIGDFIATTSTDDVFERVYSFGHYEPTAAKAKVLEIHTSSSKKAALQISHAHLVFVAPGKAVPASSLAIGDRLLVSSSSESYAAITSLKTVTTSNSGLYAPFTPSGKFLVNDGIVVSSYVTLDSSTTQTMQFGWISISHHWIAHLFQAPHRLVCHHFGSCPNETYTDGISTFVHGPMKAALWILNQPLLKDVILLPLVGMVSMLYVMEEVLIFLRSSSSSFMTIW
eukprot:CAMPEP_0194214556 /NCGR_PEP_ID=MMETSP0156-20130528/15809_1 /TAXON_ID=33649 /ORGANISM="Thalassionema nitzschioides, Strain L26-B" /LENGTH=425 /DNA_ID=CAMNT_0038942839 /DNA_START=67 /DNA_END=1341 /DNA_ORIENTATION=-